MLPRPVRWFANLELDVWKAMLEFIGFPYTEEVVQDCKAVHEENLSCLDYSAVVALAQELGENRSEMAIQEFYTQGLIH